MHSVHMQPYRNVSQCCMHHDVHGSHTSSTTAVVQLYMMLSPTLEASGSCALLLTVLPSITSLPRAAHGGQVILSESTLLALRGLKDGSAGSMVGSQAILLHMGRHELAGHPSPATLLSQALISEGSKPRAAPLSQRQGSLTTGGVDMRRTQSRLSAAGTSVPPAATAAIGVDSRLSTAGASAPPAAAVEVELYQLVPLPLLCRLSLLPPALRTERQLTPAVLESPIGCVSVAALQVVGMGILRAELPAAAVDATLAILGAVMLRCLAAHGGYIFESNGDDDGACGGLVLAAFPRPEGALRWCLACQSAMVQQEWPEELLQHELGEETRIWGWETKQQHVLHKGELSASSTT